MRKLFNLLLIALLSLSLVGCHGSNTGSNVFEVPEDFDTTRNYEISFWAKNDSNKTQVQVYKDAIVEFEKIYPNITVNLKLYTDYTNIYNDVITNISTNTTPNVCITYPDHIATYLTGSNVVASLDELMANEKYGLGGSGIKFDSVKKDEVVKEFLDECILSGSYYALPYMRSTEALYINKDYVEKLGYKIPDVLTWDFVFEVSEAAVKKDEEGTYLINGQKTMIPFIYKSTDNMTINMLQQLNAPYSNDKGEILMFNDVTRDILSQIAVHTKTGAFSTFKISSYPANYLNAGQCIFAIDSTAGATWMGSKAPQLDIPEEDLIEFETVVRPIPQYDVNNPKMISQGPSICLFSKEDSQEVLASWIFAQYLLSNSVQCAYSKTEGYLPVTTKAQNSDEYLKYLNNSGIDNDEHYDIKIEATKLLMDNIPNTFVTAVFNGSASLRLAAGQVIEETCKGANRKKEINNEFIDSLFDDMYVRYHLNQTNSVGGMVEFGPLPKESKILLGTLAITWVLIGSNFIFQRIKKKNKQ